MSVWLAVRRAVSHHPLTSVLACLCVTGVVVAVTQGVNSSGAASLATTTTTSVQGQSTGPVTSAQQAVTLAEQAIGNTAAVTRSAAKLTTWGQAISAANPSGSAPGSPETSSDKVWVVAFAGSFEDTLSLVPTPPDKWEVELIDQQTGEGMAVFAAPTGNWPPYFDALPDLSSST
jgi:hypothetical protein